MKICNEKFCRNAVKPRGKKCATCYSRIWREKNPTKAFYISQKAHAKARKIPFNITFEEFEKWAIKYKLIGHTGKTKYAYQVDRINEDDPRGYHIDNIQKLTQEENVAKQVARRKKKLDFNWQQPEFTSWVNKEIEPEPEAPF